MPDMFPTGLPAHTRPLPPPDSLRVHFQRTLKLAWPVVIARAGLVGIFTADTMMVGRVGATDLAFLGLGLALQSIFLLVAIGLLQGTLILSSQAYGAEDPGRAGAVWRAGIYHALAAGLLSGVVCLFWEDILLLSGQEASLAKGAGQVSVAFGLSMPPMLVYICTSYFLESIQRPMAGMVIMVFANLLNILLNGIFVFGWSGWVEPMGGVGAAIATSITRWFFGLALLGYVLSMPWRTGHDPFGLKMHAALWWKEAQTLGGDIGRRLRNNGMGMAIMLGFDAAALQALVIMASYLGTSELAAYQVASNGIILVVMMAIGCSSATSVRVGNAIGRNDAPNMRRAGWVGIATGLLFVLPGVLAFIFLPHQVAGIYVRDPVLRDLTAACFVIAGFVVLADGMLAPATGALRGASDVWPTMIRYVLALWFVCLPVAWFCAFFLELRVPGLLAGLWAAYMTALVLLLFRFRDVARRPLHMA